MSEMKEYGEIKAETDEEYAVNKQNMDKFNQVYKFFCNIAEEDGGDVSCFHVNDNRTSFGVSVEISMLDLYRDSIAQFIEILRYIDVLDVKTTESEGILVSAVVDHVWEGTE